MELHQLVKLKPSCRVRTAYEVRAALDIETSSATAIPRWGRPQPVDSGRPGRRLRRGTEAAARLRHHRAGAGQAQDH